MFVIYTLHNENRLQCSCTRTSTSTFTSIAMPDSAGSSSALCRRCSGSTRGGSWRACTASITAASRRASTSSRARASRTARWRWTSPALPPALAPLLAPALADEMRARVAVRRVGTATETEIETIVRWPIADARSDASISLKAHANCPAHANDLHSMPLIANYYCMFCFQT